MTAMKGRFGSNASVGVVLLASGCAFGIGCYAGYLLARKKIGEEAERRIASEVESVKQYYRERAALAGKSGDQNEREAAVGDLSFGLPRPEPPPRPRDPRFPISKITNPELFLAPQGAPGTSVHRVQDESADEAAGWTDPLAGMPGDDDAEDADDENDVSPEEGDSTIPILEQARSRPYVIAVEEFEEQVDYRKIELTYYAGDNVLVDDREAPIRDTVSAAGQGFAERFGERSKDPNILYVRNDKLQADFSIVRNPGSYTEEVLNYGRPK